MSEEKQIYEPWTPVKAEGLHQESGRIQKLSFYGRPRMDSWENVQKQTRLV